MTTISDDGTLTRLVNPQCDYQLAAFDRTQYIVGNFVWDLPKGSKLVGGSKAAGLFLDHWIISGVTTLASGQPADVGLTISGQDAGTRLLGTPTSGNLSGQQMRFLLNGDPQTGSTINMSALVVPGIGNIGPYPRTYLRNPWIVNQDLSVFKNIPFSADGKRYLQLRLEAFNALNHPQFSGYNLTSNVTNGAGADRKQHLQQLHRPGGFEQYPAGREHVGTRDLLWGAQRRAEHARRPDCRQVLFLSGISSDLWAVTRLLGAPYGPELFWGTAGRTGLPPLVVIPDTLAGDSERSTSVTKSFTGVLLFVVVMLLAIPASGQIGGTGTVRGIVSDPSGAVIPAASVVATNVGTQVKTARQTTESGDYTLSPLPAGEYTITVTASGFQTLVQEHVVVDALTTVSLNVAMQVGSASQEVTIVDRPPQLDTVDARVGQTMTNDVFMSLPLFMGNAPRDPTSFVSLEAGVPSNSGTYAYGDVFGAQGNSGEMYVEGMPLTNPAIQGETRNVLLGVSAEGVSEFQLETAGSSAMYGGQGAANFVLKSGTNHFHGATYEFFRNTDLDARNFFAATRPIERQNEFGENVAGPIRKNKVFFFQSFDEFRYLTGNNSNYYTIAPTAERTGDFSAYPSTIYDPQSLNCTNGSCTRAAFPGNIIPANRISPISKYLESFLPATLNANISNNYLGSSVYGFNNYGTTQKVDYNLTDKHRFLVLYSRGRRAQANDTRGATLPIPYGSGSSALVVHEVVTTAQARYTFVATPTLLNQLSYGIARFYQNEVNNTQSGDYSAKAGIQGLPAGGAQLEFPTVSFGGSNSPSSWGNAHPVTEVDQSFTLQDNLQWTHGKHAITFGGQIQWSEINYANNSFDSQANWSFSNAQTEGFNSAGTAVTTTGNSWASFLLGAPSSFNLQNDAAEGTGARLPGLLRVGHGQLQSIEQADVESGPPIRHHDAVRGGV